MSRDKASYSSFEDSVASETPFFMSQMSDSRRLVLTYAQLEELLLREQVKHCDWFLRNDITGRVRLIHQKKRLKRAIVLLQIPQGMPGRHKVEPQEP